MLALFLARPNDHQMKLKITIILLGLALGILGLFHSVLWAAF